MTQSNTIIRERLNKHNLRNTAVRNAILSAFYKVSGTALASKDIEERLEDVDRITLYRTLKSFEQNGIVHQVIDGTGITKYALCAHQCNDKEHHDVHAHFFCLSCEQTTCLDDTKVNQPTLAEGFVVDSLQLVLSGTCDQCT